MPPKHRRGQDGSSDGAGSEEPPVSDLMDQFKAFTSSFDAKFDSLRDSFRVEITNAVQNAIKQEMDAVRQEFHAELEKMRDQIVQISQKQQAIEQNQQSYAEATAKQNIVIKNLPETEGERTVDRVKVLLTDGLGLNDSEVEKVVTAERKGDPKMKRSHPRVVVATLKDNEVKNKVMKCKSKLKDKDQFKKIYIEIDRPVRERQMENSMRTIINTVAKDKLQMRGGKVIPKQTESG